MPYGDGQQTGMMNTGAGAGSQGMSYQQFVQQRASMEMQQAQLAQQALAATGLTNSNQQLIQIQQQLQQVSREVQQTQNQVQMQADAQIRQLNQLNQQIQSAVNLIQQVQQNRQSGVLS